jgi:hypothetical protein
VDFPLLGITIEVVDHPPLIKIMFTSKEEMNESMEEVFVAFRHMQQKINHFVSLLLIFKVPKHQHHWGVFLQHKYPR